MRGDKYDKRRNRNGGIKMNARQKAKNLKKKIDILESDNDLMRRIIADSPAMQELYDLYNKPLNIINTTMPFQEYKAIRIIPDDMVDVDGIIKHTKQLVSEDLLDGIKGNITYDVDNEQGVTSITASIFVGRK